MKINDIIQETTSAGGIATVAAPLGGMQKRPNASVFANTTPKKKKKKKTSEAKANPMIMNRDGKEIVLTKSGDSMKPKFHLKINGKDHGTFDSEKAAMQHSARLKAEATLQTGGYGKPKKSRHQQNI